MADTIINQSQTINKTTKKVETEVKSTVNNINIDLSKIDMTGAIESFKQLEAVAKAADFGAFTEKILAIKDAFSGFQKTVQTANTSVTNFAKSADKLTGGNTAIVTNVDIDTSGFVSGVAEITTGVSSAATAVGGCFAEMGEGALGLGTGIGNAATGVSALVDSITGLAYGFSSACEGALLLSEGIAAAIPLLPLLGAAVLEMAENMSGLMSYLPELIAFTGMMAIFALLGDGLSAAGDGLKNIGQGLVSMTDGMSALLAFMPIFIASLADITANIGGIILFVLLAASVVAMAVALQMMNEQMESFVESMSTLHTLMTAGFVAGFVVFGAMMIAMSLFMDKAAKGMDKVTQSMTKQAAKLAVLNPLLAVQAVLSNPIVGAVTVAAAVASGVLVGAVFPAMATGGVVSSPTVAMVGEGRYPEAVVPLGDSPQFAGMKSDIANAVVQAMRAGGEQTPRKTSGGEQIVLNIDGKTFARLILPQLKRKVIATATISR